MKTYSITIPDGVKVVTAADIRGMTPYILLELEDWFEDEIAFIRTCIEPDTLAFDIGANHGIYALAIASRLGQSGHVWAFEPTQKPLGMLRASVAENGFDHLITVVDCALSDHAGTAMMSVPFEGEASSLQVKQGNEAEKVRLDTLDASWLALGGPSVDLVKLDAEGEEERILRGGQRFFADCSPLVMFEVKSDFLHNAALPTAFQTLGYELYALVPGLGVLVPFDPAQGFEPFQLNLFACKEDRAAGLAARGLLVDFNLAATPLSAPMPNAQATLANRPFAASLGAGWELEEGVMVNALSCYLASQEKERPAPERWRLLQESLAGFEEAIRMEDHPAVRLSHLRALRATGRRDAVVRHLRPITEMGTQALVAELMRRPFLPPSGSWDQRPVNGKLEEWCAAMLADTMADCLHYSTYFNQECIKELWNVKENPNCTIGMYRKIFLIFIRSGRKIQFSASGNNIFFYDHAEHANADIWKELLSG